MKGAVKLKIEAYKAWLAYGTPEAAESYQQAKQSVVVVVTETKTQVWEEFGEAMEQSFQLRQRYSCKLFGSSRRKAVPVHTVFSVGGELLTSTASIFGWWKEYFKDLLNPVAGHAFHT